MVRLATCLIPFKTIIWNRPIHWNGKPKLVVDARLQAPPLHPRLGQQQKLQRPPL